MYKKFYPHFHRILNREVELARALSLVCDFQELYRYLVDDFLIGYCQKVKRGDFVMKKEVTSRKKVGKREYLNDSDTRGMIHEFNDYFERKVEVKRIRNGEHQTFETLVNEEALLFAKYLRGENKTWIPRVPGAL
jgi:hypothetical protein